MVEQRRRLLGDVDCCTNRLCDALKQYYPQALEWFPQRDSIVFCDFLVRWPTLGRVKLARKATLEAFLNEHNVRGAKRIEQRHMFTGQHLRLPGVAFLWYRLYEPNGTLVLAKAVRKITPPVEVDLRGSDAGGDFWAGSTGDAPGGR